MMELTYHLSGDRTIQNLKERQQNSYEKMIGHPVVTMQKNLIPFLLDGSFEQKTENTSVCKLYQQKVWSCGPVRNALHDEIRASPSLYTYTSLFYLYTKAYPP